jgi:glycerophosphoryl diester phosphodiesterase
VAATLACAALATAAATAHAHPTVHAHRGGSIRFGVPTFPENTMRAFKNAHARRFVIELDVKLARDGVPVVIHDATLDRTTTCTGLVRDRTAAQIRKRCVVDVIGSADNTRRAKRRERARVPTLAEVLTFARRSGARLNLEIKNVPTDSDFDPTSAFAQRVVRKIAASRVRRSRVIVQSFWPPNLDVAKSELPGAPTSLLTLPEMNLGAPAFAAARGWEWVSPAWPVDAAFVAEAHALGRRVVPYTLNRAGEVRAAHAADVDAIISDDPFMARRALGK